MVSLRLIPSSLRGNRVQPDAAQRRAVRSVLQNFRLNFLPTNRTFVDSVTTGLACSVTT